jgi:2'-5' RNA ligase
MAFLTHTTAVVLIPPREAWEPVQAIRRVHDRQVGRWMPHITLLYPFRPETRLDEAAAQLHQACAGIAPFPVTLVRFRHFSHGHRGFTIWLDPEPSQALVRLQDALRSAFPECDAASRHPGGFTPHLSVGQAGGVDDVEALENRFQATWRPVRFDAVAVTIIAREGAAPFVEKRVIPLAGVSTPRTA